MITRFVCLQNDEICYKDQGFPNHNNPRNSSQPSNFLLFPSFPYFLMVAHNSPPSVLGSKWYLLGCGWVASTAAAATGHNCVNTTQLKMNGRIMSNDTFCIHYNDADVQRCVVVLRLPSLGAWSFHSAAASHKDPPRHRSPVATHCHCMAMHAISATLLNAPVVAVAHFSCQLAKFYDRTGDKIYF